MCEVPTVPLTVHGVSECPSGYKPAYQGKIGTRARNPSLGSLILYFFTELHFRPFVTRNWYRQQRSVHHTRRLFYWIMPGSFCSANSDKMWQNKLPSNWEYSLARKGNLQSYFMSNKTFNFSRGIRRKMTKWSTTATSAYNIDLYYSPFCITYIKILISIIFREHFVTVDYL